MEFKNEVISLLAEICQDDIVKENPDIDLFDAGLLDSFGTVELLVQAEERFGITVPITEFDRETWNTPNQIAIQLADLK
ncbi:MULTISPECIES: D-alanine--poly(phosphoribitol) ligase subunit DltC [Neobacillus]|jgi:D-alanine--poly(phosphoribitol) ligase subunit 2|uniref:D-alanyl carrier protein n=2 Tax=Neobacillus TaxID=2675232 RepID=A0A942U2Y9_9BACI|nr:MULTISPECIES: D-alanine--poly(phosphoribitol) ligase subunit DltC [Neobacillus]MBS4211481.1 D-alanine--poly(phosphoribitol) ligase subunit DltC [Neobacillus rhizophilus]MBU8916899.1 D-alanine--poly(phosphoribitol) ligase subunit DltC [Bacillus sp. FJAT-29953]MCH6264054.1 D-alanine--poly(phosphoribitol) ligase subunit DltC [Neobacillus citreus]